jgi:excisionase family DNA binding protein
MSEQFMTVDEVAEYLRLHRQTVERMAARGDLPGVKLGRHWRFRKVALDAFLAEQAGKALTLEGATAI